MSTTVMEHPFLEVSGLAYLGLMTNVLLAASWAPLVLLSLTTDPAASWLLLAGATVLAAPGALGAFAVFRHQVETGGREVVRPFVQGWRAGLGRGIGVAAVVASMLVVLTVDIAWAWGRPVGAVAIPVLVVLLGLTASVGLGWLVAVAERPEVPVWRLARAVTYLMVRRWYLSAMSLVALGLLAVFVTRAPALGLGVAASPLLYLVWANTRRSLHPILVNRNPTP